MLKILKAIIIFVIFIFIFSVSIFFWKHSFASNQEKIEIMKYEDVIQKINLKNQKDIIKVENFINQNHNIYGTLTAMVLAKEYVLYNDLDKAYLHLNNCLEYTTEDNLKNILQLRIVQIKIQQNKYEEAMNILKKIHNNNWKNITENMKGDIFLNKNNKKLAIKYWEKSISLEDSNASKDIIKMKINDIK